MIESVNKLNILISYNTVKMAIFTTFGQFVEFGSPKVETNFSWEYYYNLQYFDGFILGWTENCINYIASLIVEVLN